MLEHIEVLCDRRRQLETELEAALDQGDAASADALRLQLEALDKQIDEATRSAQH